MLAFGAISPENLQKTTWAGAGTAGGYGYHKGSAAVESAFRAAGIKFNSEVGGCGWERVKDAVQAAGEMLIDNSAPVYVVEMYA